MFLLRFLFRSVLAWAATRLLARLLPSLGRVVQRVLRP
jgi:hypothetical protein